MMYVKVNQVGKVRNLEHNMNRIGSIRLLHWNVNFDLESHPWYTS